MEEGRTSHPRTLGPGPPALDMCWVWQAALPSPCPAGVPMRPLLPVQAGHVVKAAWVGLVCLQMDGWSPASEAAPAPPPVGLLGLCL